MQTDERDEADTPADDGMGQPGQPADVIDAFGTLSISEHGISRFFGPTGGSEVPSLFLCIFSCLTLYILSLESAFSKFIPSPPCDRHPISGF